MCLLPVPTLQIRTTVLKFPPVPPYPQSSVLPGPPHASRVTFSQIRELARIEQMIPRRLEHFQRRAHGDLALVLRYTQHAKAGLILRRAALVDSPESAQTDSQSARPSLPSPQRKRYERRATHFINSSHGSLACFSAVSGFTLGTWQRAHRATTSRSMLYSASSSWNVVDSRTRFHASSSQG